ncbi:MAG: hypothetical protein AAB486_01495 [Patescibacteria group bacterium]
MPGAPFVLALGEQHHLRRGTTYVVHQALQHSRQLRVVTFFSTAAMQPHHLMEASVAVVFCDGMFFTIVGPHLREQRPTLPVIVVCPEAFSIPVNDGVTYLPGCTDYSVLHEALYKVMGVQ